MAHLIDKSALLAEIERLVNNYENGGCKFDGWVENIKQAMKDGTTKR